MKVYLTATLLAGLLASACTPSRQPAEQVEAEKPATIEQGVAESEPEFPKIEQKKWLLTEYEYQKRTFKPMENHVPAMEIREGRLNGTSGCNRFNGEVTLRKDGTMSVGDLATTKMLCQGVMTQEGRLLELLQNARSYSVNEMFLEINSEFGRMSFRHPSEG
jgi:heat shock protein HslJ